VLEEDENLPFCVWFDFVTPFCLMFVAWLVCLKCISIWMNVKKKKSFFYCFHWFQISICLMFHMNFEYYKVWYFGNQFKFNTYMLLVCCNVHEFDEIDCDMNYSVLLWTMAYAAPKPTKVGLEESQEQIHKIRITLSSKHVKNLEKG
jgi:hypothetical protein